MSTDGLRTPAILTTKAKLVRERYQETGQEQSGIALEMLREDPTLDGLEDWQLVSMARGIAATASMLNTGTNERTARANRDATGNTKRDLRLAVLWMTFTVGGKPYSYLTASLDVHKAYQLEQENDAAGATLRANITESVIVKRLESAGVDTVEKLERSEWYVIADAIAELKRGEAEAA